MRTRTKFLPSLPPGNTPTKSEISWTRVHVQVVTIGRLLGERKNSWKSHGNGISNFTWLCIPSVCVFPAKVTRSIYIYVPFFRKQQKHTRLRVCRVSKKMFWSTQDPTLTRLYIHLQLSNIYIYVRFLFGQLIIQSCMHSNFSLVFSHLPLDVKFFPWNVKLSWRPMRWLNILICMSTIQESD